MNHHFIFLNQARYSVNNGDRINVLEDTVSAHSHIVPVLRSLSDERHYDNMRFCQQERGYVKIRQDEATHIVKST